MLANNSFIKVAIKAQGNGVRNASELKKAFLHIHEGKMYLLTHIQTIHRTDITGIPMHGMRCVSLWRNVYESDTWQDFDECEINRVYIQVFFDAETVASVHDRAASTGTRTRRTTTAAPAMAETSAPAENPYMLSNYTGREYRGFAGYHSSHGESMNTPTNGYTGYRIGVELETEFTTDAARTQFTGTPRNWFFCESDGSLRGAGCEIITIPLIPDDAKNRATWKPICDRLKQLGATSWDNNRCGLHVHIGREILGDTTEERDTTLSRILLFYNLYLNDDATSNKVFGRVRCYNEGRHEDTQEFAAVKCLGAKVLKDKEISKRVSDAMKAKQSRNRYYTINTTNRATIEFRKGRGSLSVDRIQTIITFCEAVCLYCKTSEDVSELTLDGFREFIRTNIPTTNSLYHYYDVIESDC